MKWASLFLISLFLVGGSVLWADDMPSYEANPDLINVDGYVIFFDAQGPMSYADATPGTIPPTAVALGPVHSEACAHGLSVPFTANFKSRSAKVGGALGKGGYIQALTNLKKEKPDIDGIYDVKVDLHFTSVLSTYSRYCTEITALAYK